MKVEQWQLACDYGLQNHHDSGDDGKEENNSMLILRIVAVKYPRKDGNVVIDEIFTKVMTPSANKRKCDFGEEARNSDYTEDDSRLSDSLYDSNQPHVPGFVDWWTSGDARLLFAPCGKYNNNCNVKDIVMDRIELLVLVNQNSSNWRLVVEEGDKENTCSANDIFMIRQRCMYLVIGLHKFVNEEQTGMRWTWKKCIMHSMSEMNDVVVEGYTNWQPLQRWHAWSNCY